MTKRNLTSGVLCLFFGCCFSIVSSAQIKADRILSARDQSIKEQWVAFKKNRPVIRQQENVYTLPVVFHIIHQNGAENIPDATVIDAFQRLNDAFANRGIYDQGS